MPPTPRHSWLWFIGLLVILTIAAISIQIWYNQGKLLTIEKLQAAQARWKAKNIRDYDMEYTTKKRKVDSEENYSVKVRGGKVVEVARNGRPVEERLYHYHDMAALFSFIDDYLRQDEEAVKSGKRRPYVFGDFNPEFGYLRRFVRSVSASATEHVEIIVTFKTVGEPGV